MKEEVIENEDRGIEIFGSKINSNKSLSNETLNIVMEWWSQNLREPPKSSLNWLISIWVEGGISHPTCYRFIGLLSSLSLKEWIQNFLNIKDAIHMHYKVPLHVTEVSNHLVVTRLSTRDFHLQASKAISDR